MAEKQCPACAELVKAGARICRFCNYDFVTEIRPLTPTTASPKSAPEPASPQSLPSPPPVLAAANPSSQTIANSGEGASTGAVGLVGAVVFTVLIVGALLILGWWADTPSSYTPPVEPDPEYAEPLEAQAAEAVETEAAPVVPLVKWGYYDQNDDVSGKRIRYANLNSNNTTEFDFPYQGGSDLQIIVRKHPRWGTDVMFRISKGQMLCNYDGCEGAIRFGSNGVEKLTLVEPSDNSNEYVFAQYSDAMIRGFKRADTVVVEIPFYQSGSRSFTFDTRGFVWPPK